MTKPTPRISSRKNRCIGWRKNGRRMPKGIIHVQASFNNTIKTVTDVRGRVGSWSSAGTSRFKGTKRGTPSAAQAAAANAIHWSPVKMLISITITFNKAQKEEHLLLLKPQQQMLFIGLQLKC